MEYLALIIGAVSSLIEKFYNFEENRIAKKFFFWLSICSFLVGIYQVFDKNKESDIEKAILKDRHVQDSIYLNKIIDNQNLQKKIQLDSFEKILKKEYALIESSKELNRQSSNLQKKLQLQTDEISKSKHQITDDFYCYFETTISLTNNDLQKFEDSILSYLTKSNYYFSPSNKERKFSQFNESIFTKNVFSKFCEIRMNIFLKKDNKRFIELAHNGILKFDTDLFSSIGVELSNPSGLLATYFPYRHKLLIFGKVPLKITYQNYEYSSIKDFINSEFNVTFSIGNIVNNPLFFLTTDFNDNLLELKNRGFITETKTLKYDSLGIQLVAKKNIFITPKNLERFNDKSIGKVFKSRISIKDFNE